MTGRDLLAAAKRSLGYDISRDVLKSFREEGLVPRPEGRGPAAAYPPGTLQQLIAVSRRHTRERRYHELRLEVWWAGHWVQNEKLRLSLAKILDDGVADIRQAHEQNPSPFDAAEAIMSEMGRPSKSRSPVTRLLLTRVDRDELNLRTALHTFFVFALGGEPEWDTLDVGLDEPSPLDLLMKVCGFDRVTTDLLANGQPLIRELPDLPALLTELRNAGILDFLHPGDTMRDIPEPELEIARIRARQLWNEFANAVDLLEYRHGRDVSGLGAVTALRRHDWNWTRLGLVRYYCLASRVVSDDATDTFLSQIGSSRAQVAAALAVTREFPGFKPFLSVGGERRLQALPVEEREHISATLTNYLSQHGELERALKLEYD